MTQGAMPFLRILLDSTREDDAGTIAARDLTAVPSHLRLPESNPHPSFGGKMAYKFEVYKDKAGEFRFRFKASNGEIMFGSEGYAQKASALSAIDSIKKHAPAADIDDQIK